VSCFRVDKPDKKRKTGEKGERERERKKREEKLKRKRVTYLLNCATNPCYFKLLHKSNKLVAGFYSPLDEACLSKFENNRRQCDMFEFSFSLLFFFETKLF